MTWLIIEHSQYDLCRHVNQQTMAKVVFYELICYKATTNQGMFSCLKNVILNVC